MRYVYNGDAGVKIPGKSNFQQSKKRKMGKMKKIKGEEELKRKENGKKKRAIESAIHESLQPIS